jgi:hypothetical protein
MILLALVAASGLRISSIGADETRPSAQANSEGDVPSFYVRAVTGPLAGKSVCYVCRNGDRPVVLVFLRDLGPDVAALLKDLDHTVNRHRADGLRCFAVMLTDTPQRDFGRLQTLAFDEKIDLPLTMAGEAVTAGTSLAVPRDAGISVIAYQDRRVVQRFSYKTGDCNEAARRSIVEASVKLISADEK